MRYNAVPIVNISQHELPMKKHWFLFQHLLMHFLSVNNISWIWANIN